MAEVYKEKIKDLLDTSKTDLDVREDKVKGPYIKNITEQFCVSEQEVYDLIIKGTNNRHVEAT